MRRSLLVPLTIAALAVGVPTSATAKPKKAAKPTVSMKAPKGTLTAGASIKLTIKAKAPKGRKLTRYTLSFGDGSKATKGKRKPKGSVKHTFKKAGTFTVKLTVTDNRKRSATGKLKLKIAAPKQPAAPTQPAPQPAPAPLPPLNLDAAAVTVAVGSQVLIALPEPLVTVSSIDASQGLPANVGAALLNAAVAIAATAQAAPTPESTVTLTGRGCTSTECDRAFTVRVPVTVRGIEAPPGRLDDTTAASPDRVAAALPIPDTANGKMLRDEMIVALGTPDDPGTRADAEAVAEETGGVVSGGLQDIGIYELRWATPQDLDELRDDLEGIDGVADVTNSTLGLVGDTAEPPGDWDDDGNATKWPFRVSLLQRAWDKTTGGSVKVGIVDGGQVLQHEDLNIAKRIGNDGPEAHSTHVAGLACAKANGKGVVGAAWGCPIVTSGIGNQEDDQILAAATKVAAVDGVKVVNMSLGYNMEYDSKGYRPCATAAQADAFIARAQDFKDDFRFLFRSALGRNIVWTIAAGNNCARGVHSPWGLNSDLGNVLTVAAINSDGKLANFSNFGEGVEVAAPGGVGVGGDGDGTVGLWSTIYNKGCRGFTCEGYGPMYGTSMAAPIVAGIAALVREKNPSLGASSAAGCITSTAGQGGVGKATVRSELPARGNGYFPSVQYNETIPIVNAQWAVDCNTLQFSSGPGTGAPPATLGGYAMTKFGADTRTIGNIVGSVADTAGTILFSPGLFHLRVPSSWQTWSHGYSGDVYFTGDDGEGRVWIGLPAGTKAFYFYGEPNTFSSYTVEAIADDGRSSEPVDIQGRSGARFFGFYATEGRSVSSIIVTASDPRGFAIGEFGIGR